MCRSKRAGGDLGTLPIDQVIRIISEASKRNVEVTKELIKDMGI